MSGHSKWSSIKHKKASTDSKRSKMFTRILREVTVAARIGGGDSAGNPRLRKAVTEARSNNVPNDNIERAIKKGTGELEGSNYEETAFEGYGAGGVAVMVEVLTDNRNRTVPELRYLFSKYGGNLGETGCVGWMFDKRGHFVLSRTGLDEEAFVELAIDLDVEDFEIEEDGYELFTAPEEFATVRENLEQRQGIEVTVGELALIPQNQVELGTEQARKVLRLLDALEEHDDVQGVWANLEVSQEVLAALA